MRGTFVKVLNFDKGFFMRNIITDNLVISTKEKSLREARQRLDSRCGVTCEDFSSVEMTKKRGKTSEQDKKSILLMLFCISLISFKSLVMNMHSV